ncbi:MAG: helix-turn-helix domain-containing protein [Bacillota bacterium]|nr:helix-turn-helix domain-containing protein [Bacillota bacterium]
MILLIKPYRIIKKLQLKQVSKLTGMSISYLSQLENNHKNPTLSTIKKIAIALKICPIHLLAGCGNTKCSKGCYYYKDYYNQYNNLPLEIQNELENSIIYIKRKHHLI